MDLTATLLMAAGLAALAGFAAWRGARGPDPKRGPRLMPWRLVMMLAAAGFVYAAGHAVALLKGPT